MELPGTETIQNEAENNISNKEIASSISTSEESIQTNSEVSDTKEYFNSSRLERDTMYSQMLESYQKILDSTTTSEKQKSAAQEEIDKINRHINELVYDKSQLKKAYNYYHGVRDAEQFKHIEENFGIG